MSTSYQVSQTLGLFRHLIVLILGKNSVKSLSVTKNVTTIKIEGVWNKLEANKKVSIDNNSQHI